MAIIDISDIIIKSSQLEENLEKRKKDTHH